MASEILETFGIIFDSDAEEVTKGAKDAEKATESLDDAIDDVDRSTKDLGSSFNDLIGSAGAALVGILGVGALTAGVVNAAQMTDEIGKFSETLDLSVSDVDAWSEAVVRSGGDANGFRSSIQSLTERLTDFNLTGGGPAAEVFKKIGINAKDSEGKIKEAFDILPELAESFKDLSKSEAAGLGQRLGLDQGTILLLQQGRKAVEDLVDRQKQLGVVTQEDYLIAAKFNDQWADMQQIFRSIFVTADTTILPVFTDLLKYAEDAIFFLSDNQHLIEGFFIGVAGVITATYAPAMASAAAATVVAAAPFVAIGLAILVAGIAFALIYDDIQNFIEGNDSMIGQILKEYPVIEKIVLSLYGAITDTISNLSIAADYVTSAFNDPKKAVQELWDLIKEFFSYLEEKIPSIEDIGKTLGFGQAGQVDINNKFVVDDGAPLSNLQKAGAAFNSIDRNPLNGATSNSITTSSREVNRTTSVKVDNINVHTKATDAKGIAEGANSAFSDQMQSMVNDFDDSVDR